jgi:hypothetical protein
MRLNRTGAPRTLVEATRDIAVSSRAETTVAWALGKIEILGTRSTVCLVLLIAGNGERTNASKEEITFLAATVQNLLVALVEVAGPERRAIH